MDCTKVEYVETSETIVHILTGARLEVTRRTPRSTPILSVACHYSTLQGARLRPGTSRWQKAGELTQPLPLTPSEQGRTIPPRSNTAGSVSHRSTPPGSLYSFLHSSPSSAGDDERPRGLSKYIEFDEVSQGPDVQPGHWVLTGLALLLVEGDRLGLQAKFSLLYYE